MGIKDLTDADFKKINEKLKNAGSDLLINPKLAKSINEILPKGIKLELDPQLKAVSNEALAKAVEGKVMKVEVMPLLTHLRKALKDATVASPPEIEVGIQSTKLRTLIEGVLNKHGFMINISTANDNYTKAVQQKLNGARYTVKIHADANEITRSVQASLMQVQSRSFGLKVSRDILYRSIDEALGNHRFPITVYVRTENARNAVQTALSKAGGLGTQDILNHQRLMKAEAAAAAAELNRLKAAHMGAADAAKAHATASVNLGGAMGSNIKIAGELGSAMTSLYSIHAAKQFLSQVVEIGGELEHQKIAMNTIFGDKGKTNVLFEQVKGLARTSPFGVMELSKSVKALSAYGVQYNEIYDTAKRLADISAATSVDINRLILAFGKTKSRGFLDGLEAKQFAYANIPIYEMVRKKLEELEGQAVTTQQVMERMRKREISFDIVKDVLWDITDPGGKFYNMQEALAGSVKTSWKLVRDNIELMFGEIAESAVGNTLKSTAEILQGLTREWRTVGTVVTTAAIGLGVYKVATLGVNSAVQKGTIATYNQIIAQKQKSAEELKAWGRITQLDRAEKMRIATANKLVNADLRQALTEGKLTDKHIAQLFWQKKITAEQVKHLTNIGLLNPAMSKAILSNNRFTLSLQMMKQGLVSAGVAMKAFLLNPWTIGIAAFTSLVGLWQRHSEKIEETKENIKQLGETAREGSRSLSAEVEKLNAQNPETMVSSDFLNSIEEMKNTLKDYDPTWMDAFKEAFARDEAGNIKSLAEQYNILKQAVIETAEAYKYLNQIKDAAYDAQDETDGWFDDSMLENIKDFSDASREYEKIVGKLVAHSDMAEKAVGFGMEASPAYALAAANKPLEEQIKLLVEYKDAWSAVFQGFNVRYSLLESWGIGRSEEQKFIADLMDLPSKIQDVNIAINSMQEDEGNFAEGLKSRLEGKWGNKEQWTEPMKKAVIKAVRDVYSKAEGVAKEEADKLANQTLTTVFKFKITTDFELDSQQLNDWQNELDNLTKGQFTTIIRMAPDYLTALSEIQNATDEAQKKLDDAKLKMPIDIQFNGDFGMTPNQIPYWSVMSPSERNAATSMLGWLKQLAGASAGNITPTPQKSKGGTTKDAFAEAVKERINLLKKAKSEYESLAKLVGTEAASKELAESPIFAGLKANEFLPEQAIPKTLDDYEKELDKLQVMLTAKGLKTKKHRELNVEIEQVKFDINKKKTEEALKLALDKVSKEAERQLADWNLYEKVRKATGNETLAFNLAFGMNGDGQTDYVRLMKDKFDAIAKEYGSAFTYDTATPELLQKEGIQEVQKAYEQTYGDISKYHQKESEEVADILAKYQSLQDKIAKIDYDRNEEIRKINESKDLTPEQKAQTIQRINVEADYQKFTQSNEYLQFFAGIYALTEQEATRIGDLIEQNLNRRLQAGTISAEDYYKEIERIKRQLDKLRNVKSDAMTFLTGGVKGLSEKRQETNNAKRLEITQKIADLESRLQKAREEGDKHQEALLMAQLRGAKEELVLQDKIRDKIIKNKQQWQSVLDVANIVSNIAGGLSDAFGSIKDMADAFGVDTETGGWLDVGGVLDTLSSVTSGVSKAVQSAMSGDIGGILGGVVSTLTTPFTIWAQLHDKKLQKQIEEYSRIYDLLDSQLSLISERLTYALGSSKQIKDPQAESDLQKYNAALQRAQTGSGFSAQIGGITAKVLRHRVEAYKEGGVYAYQRALMEEQRSNLISQRNAEANKKDSDQGAIDSYNSQIASLEQQIRDFAETTIETLYGINLRSFAEDIGSALIDAFAKGEDAAEAFDEAVGDIMRDVIKQMAIKNILEQQFEGMRTFLFGTDGMSGAFGEDFELDAEEAAALKTYFDKIKNEAIPAVQKLFDGVNDATGGLLEETDKAKSGLSAGIQAMTESTGDLVASYLNGIRGDVSVQTHELWPRLLDVTLPQISVIAQSQLDAQRQIAENTLRNAVAAEAIVKSNNDISRLLTRVSQGGAKFHIQ